MKPQKPLDPETVRTLERADFETALLHLRYARLAYRKAAAIDGDWTARVRIEDAFDRAARELRMFARCRGLNLDAPKKRRRADRADGN